MSTYTVASGDSMWAISVARGISLDALIAANPQVSDPSQIEVGQVLNIPGGDAPADPNPCHLYTSDAADDLICVGIGGGRGLNKQSKQSQRRYSTDA
ncbi:hypothetical protein ACJ73_09978, partial [Blastomyces percursus]